jgi:hypothetical protein
MLERLSAPNESLIVVSICVVLPCLGAIAPVTDDDALAHVVPIARHIAETDTLRIWMDQARSMWPESQARFCWRMCCGAVAIGWAH